MLEQVSVRRQNHCVRVRVAVRVGAPVSTAAGKQDLDGPHQIPSAASKDELQDGRFVSREDLLQDLQRWSVGSEAERQVDGAPEAFDQDVLLRGADGVFRRTPRFGFLPAVAGLGEAVATLVRIGGRLWRLGRVAGVRFGALRGTDGVLLSVTGAAPVFPT